MVRPTNPRTKTSNPNPQQILKVGDHVLLKNTGNRNDEAVGTITNINPLTTYPYVIKIPKHNVEIVDRYENLKKISKNEYLARLI